MSVANLWNKFNLHRAKVVIIVFLIVCSSAHGQSWLWARKNNPNYDEKRTLSYGFLIGLHSTTFQVKYDDRFVTPDYDTVFSVEADWKPGFSLGFLVNYRIHEVLDLRITPTVAFYEHYLQYIYTDRSTAEQLVETTMVEFPLLLKYKSARRGNIRMYVVGGVKPGVEASGKKKLEGASKSLQAKSFNLNLDAGIGFDLYFPLFKFSPEVRFSRGIVDVLGNPASDYAKPLHRLNTNTVNVYLIFQ